MHNFKTDTSMSHTLCDDVAHALEVNLGASHVLECGCNVFAEPLLGKWLTLLVIQEDSVMSGGDFIPFL